MKYIADNGEEYNLPDGLDLWKQTLGPIERQRVEAGHIGVTACRSLWKWFGFMSRVPRSLTPVSGLEGVKVIALDSPDKVVDVHNTLAEIFGEPKLNEKE